MFSLSIFTPSLLPTYCCRRARCFEQNVAVYADDEFVARRHFDGWLSVQVLARDLGTGLAQFLAYRVGGGLPWVRVSTGSLIGSLRNLERGRE